MTEKSSWLWHDGAFKSTDAPVLTAYDRLRLGHGVFDTMLAVAGCLQFAALHYARLVRHAAVMGIICPYTPEDLTKAASELLNRNGLGNEQAAVNTLLTQGPAKRGLRSPKDPSPQLIIKASRFPEMPQAVTLITAQSTRRNEHSPLSNIKSCNYGDNILAINEAEAKGADDALMLNTQGAVACSTAGNVLVMLGGTIYTPPLSSGAMDGIIRSRLLDAGLAHERSITAEDLHGAESLWICNSLRGIIPVIRLNNRNMTVPSNIDFRNFHIFKP